MKEIEFQSLEKITSNLKNKVTQLSNGQLSVNEIEDLTNSAKELYERMVIIRFKAFENLKENESPKLEENSTTNKESEPISDDEELMMFDFTGEDSYTPSRIEKDEPKETDVEQNKINEEVQLIGDVNVDTSLNDIFKSEDNSLAGKLTKAPISDLKSNIGINRKFLYINDLFDGSNQAYEQAVEDLNSSTSRIDAFLILEDLKSKNNWDFAHQSVISFTDIVERRFQS